MSRPSLWVATATALVTFGLRTASANDEADELFEQGKRALAREAFAVACPAFEKSYALDPKLGALFTLAECEARAGHHERAWNHFRRFVERATLEAKGDEKHSARLSVAQQRLLELGARVALMTIDVTGDAPEDASLLVDGKEISRADWGREFAYSPGRHHVRLRSAGRPDVESHTETAAGENRVITLLVQTLPGPLPQTPPPPPDSSETRGASPWSAVGWTAVGLGTAALVASGVITVVLLEKRSIIEDNCEGPLCNEVGFAETEAVPALSLAATITFVGGLSAIALGSAFVIVGSTAGRASAGSALPSWSAALSPSGAVFSGTF